MRGLGGEVADGHSRRRARRSLSSHLSFPEIAAELYLSANTVRAQASSVYRKLGASSRSRPSPAPASSDSSKADHRIQRVDLVPDVPHGSDHKALVNHDQNLMAVSYVLAALLASLAMSLVAALNNYRTLIDDVRGRPLKMLTALAAAAYFNAFLHEIPNVFAHEWTYTNFPLPTVRIFDVPVIALMGWPLLLAFPLSVYYWVKLSVFPDIPDTAHLDPGEPARPSPG